MAAGGGIAGVIVEIVGSLWRARQNQLVTTYGSSRWASKDEISKSGLFNPKGVFLGELYIMVDFCHLPSYIKERQGDR